MEDSGGCVWRVVDSVTADYKSIIRWGSDMGISPGLPMTSQAVLGFLRPAACEGLSSHWPILIDSTPFRLNLIIKENKEYEKEYILMKYTEQGTRPEFMSSES